MATELTRSEQAARPHDPPSYDLNSAKFNIDAYMDKVVRENSLGGIVELESTMNREMRQMDSDMQTLVYENYSKFISATDTIRQMKTNFDRMEAEMARLSENMSTITAASEEMATRLAPNTEKTAKWLGVHACLRKIDLLLHLPETLRRCVSDGRLEEAVEYYLGVEKVLNADEPAFEGIRRDCESAVDLVKSELKRVTFTPPSSGPDADPRHLAHNIYLLKRLGESTEGLCDQFLSQATDRLNVDLDHLETRAKAAGGVDGDLLAFVDVESNTFLGNLSLVIANFNSMFFASSSPDGPAHVAAMKKLVRFVNLIMHRYFSVVETRFRNEPPVSGDTANLVRALDRFHRRLQAMTQLLPDMDFSQTAMEVIASVAKSECQARLRAAEAHLSGCLSAIRQRLLDTPDHDLSQLLELLNAAVVGHLKTTLVNLQAFLATDITFAAKTYFQMTFCARDVREGFLVAYFRSLAATCESLPATLVNPSPPASFFLVLSRFCIHVEQSTIGYLLTLADEQFLLNNSTPMYPGAPSTPPLTARTILCREQRSAATRLLEHYVRLAGSALADLIGRAADPKTTWIGGPEPSAVKPAMKRLVEELNLAERQLIQLGVDEGRGHGDTESIDSSRRMSGWPRLSTLGLGPNANQNINFGRPSSLSSSPAIRQPTGQSLQLVNRLFVEKVAVFGPVDFTRTSILTGVIKIMLKALIESIRLRTVDKFGFQQIQIDTYYLYIFLSRFVKDEKIIQQMLDDALLSAANRALVVQPLDQHVVARLCEPSAYS